jgi:DNA-binding MarR family transcriptional regulator
MIELEELGEVEQAILEEAYEGLKNQEKRTQTEIASLTGKHDSQISKSLKQLKSQGLVEKEDSGRTKKISLTDKGSKTLLHLISGTQEELNNLLSLHKLSVKMPIQNLKELKQSRYHRWREEMFNEYSIEHTYHSSNDSFRIHESEYQFTVTRDNVIITLDEIVGTDSMRLKTRAFQRIKKASSMIEDKTEIKLKDDYRRINCEISTQHMAIQGDPLSKLVSELKSMNAPVTITDQNGDALAWIDDSDGKKHLEAGDKCLKGVTEDNIQAVLDFYSWIIENSEEHRRFRKWVEKEFSQDNSQGSKTVHGRSMNEGVCKEIGITVNNQYLVPN